MSNLKKYLIHFSITFFSIFLFLIITTTLYYFNIISPKIYNIIKLITFLLSIFINSLILGKNTSSKGYLEGLKLSLFLIFLFLIITLITKSFAIKHLLYYLIIIITSVFGGMVGISNKKES